MKLLRPCFASLTALVAFGTLVGCGKAELTEGELCRSDNDCSSNETCERIATRELNPAVVAPCPMTFVPCPGGSGCGAGEACWPSSRVPSAFAYPNCFVPPEICAPACPNTPCYPEEVCEASGDCRLTACDEEGAVACPSHWECNPSAAPFEPNTPASGASEPDSTDLTRNIARGCARLRCDQPGGFTCKTDWTCAPESATDPSGCVPLPCTETGRCSSEDNYICMPETSGERPAGADVHGCVVRNCDEGRPCEFLVASVDVGYCDFQGPYANAYGCAARPCEESGGLCRADQTCDPGSATADPRGCRNAACDEGYTCPSAYTCAPESQQADSRGCVFTDVEGSGGTAQGGTGTAGSGGNSAGSDARGGSAQGGSAQGGSAQGGSSAGTSSDAGRGGSAPGGGAGGSSGSGDPGDEPSGHCVPR